MIYNRVSRCRGCGAQIIWAVHGKTMRRMPLDPEASQTGNLVLDGEVVWPRGPLDEGPFHVSHFATCSAADYFRRKKP